MNILILSCGIRNKIIDYFKSALDGHGKVYAADCSPYAPALYLADEHFIVPRIDDLHYIQHILELCKTHQISGLISLIDPEMSLLVRHTEAFKEIGTLLVSSDSATNELFIDKIRTQQFLHDHGFQTLDTYTESESFEKALNESILSLPVIIKPVKGSASIGLHLAKTLTEVQFLMDKYKSAIAQAYVKGTEYGVDAYIDLITGEPISIFIKKKLSMRAGETYKSISVINEALTDMLVDFIEAAGFRGVIDIDVIEKNGTFYIIEVNTRFGGGYPMSHNYGANFPRLIIRNLKGLPNTQALNQYESGIIAMKYIEIAVVKECDI